MATGVQPVSSVCVAFENTPHTRFGSPLAFWGALGDAKSATISPLYSMRCVAVQRPALKADAKVMRPVAVLDSRRTPLVGHASCLLWLHMQIRFYCGSYRRLRKRSCSRPIPLQPVRDALRILFYKAKRSRLRRADERYSSLFNGGRELASIARSLARANPKKQVQTSKFR